MKRRDLLQGMALVGSFGGGLVGWTPKAWAVLPPEARLFSEFSKSPGFSASFVEEKHIALLKQPIVNHGRLYFSSPESFARHVDKPFRSGIFLQRRTVILWDGRGTKEVSLDQHPGVAALATSFLSLLQGKRDKLELNYHVTFAGNYEQWDLKLLPKQGDLKRMLKALSFSGKGLALAEMRLTEASGDYSVTRFADARPDRNFSESEKARYFSVPKS